MTRYRNTQRVSADRLASQLPKPARKAGFSTFESGCGRETDCLLEGDGFELPVPRELGLRRGRRLALYLGSLTLRRRGPDWNATKRRRDSERRASTAAERGIEKTDELRRLKNARNRKSSGESDANLTNTRRNGYLYAVTPVECAR